MKKRKPTPISPSEPKANPRHSPTLGHKHKYVRAFFHSRLPAGPHPASAIFPENTSGKRREERKTHTVFQRRHLLCFLDPLRPELVPPIRQHQARKYCIDSDLWPLSLRKTPHKMQTSGFRDRVPHCATTRGEGGDGG